MEAKAIAKDIRISADKTRLVMNLVRNKSVNEAGSILKNINNKASKVILNVLNSAVANAENNLGLNRNNLYVAKGLVNEGSVMKRGMFDSRGHIGHKDHRTSHVSIVVSEKQA